MSDLQSGFYLGTTGHKRQHPVEHSFNYRLFLFWLDLDELEELNTRWFFSSERFNLFAFHKKDHFKFANHKSNPTGAQNLIEGSGNLKSKVIEYAHRFYPELELAKVRLLTSVRILGYVFNPVSFYYCYDESEKLQIILVEVNNTFGEQHPILIQAQPGITRHREAKNFYVSPFIKPDSELLLSIPEPGERLNLSVVSLENEQPVLTAWIQTQFKNWKQLNLAILFLRYPMQTLVVIVAIHYQALRLWLKKLNFYTKKDSDQQLAQIKKQGALA